MRTKKQIQQEIDYYETLQSTIKIFLNGSYGKLSSKYSSLYDPEMLLAVTLTGQLTMLMVIERLVSAGINVIASNTDSITYVCDKSDKALAESIVFDVELESGLLFDFEQFTSLYARDINNYLAVYPDEVKAKGVYAKPTLSKNSEYPIVFEAIRRYLFDNAVRLEDTITECMDVRQFLTARTVKTGGVWNGEYLGRVVRWYYAKDGKSIHYKNNGNKVPKSDGAHPMMELSDSLPLDLDYDKYIELAIGHLEDTGVKYVR